jgi:PBP1b-binding outer membrane lipoprotein LpoB
MARKREIVLLMLLLAIITCGCSSAPETTPAFTAEITPAPPTPAPTETLAATPAPSPEPSAAPTINEAYLYDGIYVPPPHRR